MLGGLGPIPDPQPPSTAGSGDDRRVRSASRAAKPGPLAPLARPKRRAAASRRRSPRAAAPPKRRARPQLPQPLLERLELGPQLARKPVAEPRVVLVHLRQLKLPLLGIDGHQLLHRLLADVEAIPGDATLTGARDQPDLGFDRLGLTVAAPEDPRQDACVLPEAGPQE